MTRSIACAGLVLVMCILLVSCRGQRGGCESDKDCKGERICKSGECVDPAKVVATPTRPAVSPRTIGAGTAADGTWTASFKVEQVAGDAGLTYLAAQEHCASKGLALCTETQWMRACDDDPKIAEFPSWSLSAFEREGFVVRGGGSCSRRAITRGSETSPSRVGVCCERAVGIRSANKNDAFLMRASERVLELEHANQHRAVDALERLYDDNIFFLNREYTRQELIAEAKKYFRRYPDQWLLYDVCDIRIEKGADESLVSDCLAVGHRGAEVAVVMQQIVRGGPEGRIQKLVEPRTIRKYTPQ